MLIEIRIGPGRWKLKSIIHTVGAKCEVNVQKVPHLTLYGPFNAGQIALEKIKQIIESSCGDCSYLPFSVDDYEIRKSPNGKGWILAFKILPSESLERFRNKLAEDLRELAPSAQSWDDGSSPFWFHVSMALNLRKPEADKVWALLHDGKHSVLGMFLNFIGLRRIEEKHFCLPMNGLRITLLSNKRKIICEYDLPRKMWLSRKEALDRDEWKRTLKSFRIKAGIEGHVEKPNREKSVYVISDLHLDHANIIRYCARPFSFSDVNEMNQVLVRNWNITVKSDDTVYFLGDMSFGRGSRPAEYWLKQLNGNIIFIKGGHDRKRNAKDYDIMHHGDHEFLLIHDPDKIPMK